MIVDILDWQDIKIGTLELPDDSTPEYIQQRLAPYKVRPLGTDVLRDTIKARKDYADDLIERFKYRNVSEGINALQAMYMHHKMRALTVTFYGVPMTLDILNMVVSGDIEVACLSLMNCSPDTGLLPYHWLTQDRVDWLVSDMKKYLGWT